MSHTPDDDVAFEEVDSEIEDRSAAFTTYEIVTYPADYTLAGLVDKLTREQVKIPPFQRNFVWNLRQASRLIESFLIGLPVPSIFLYTDRSDMNNQLVVDGQQRLRTVAYFFEGYFGEPNKAGKRQVFKLTGLHPDSPYANKTYEDLKRDDPAAWNRLNDAVLRAFVIQQLNPADDTSVYLVFERLNTGGTQLSPQEIRNAVNHGPFNRLLHEMNESQTWRPLFGSPDPDRRQRDVEMILRAIALTEERDSYEKPMKEFLNKFMHSKRDVNTDELDRIRSRFESAVNVASQLGKRPFRRKAGFNAAIFDAVMTTLMTVDTSHLTETVLRDRYADLLADEKFLEAITSATTDKDVINSRIAIASDYLSGTP